MKNSTRAFIQDLDRKDIRYLIEREGVNDETDMVSIQYEGVNMNQIRTSVFLSDINAGYRIFSIAKVPNEKRQKVLEKINELHNKWRWVSFAIDEDSELCSRLDVFYSENDIEIYAQALYQIVDITDKCYPEIMNALWS